MACEEQMIIISWVLLHNSQCKGPYHLHLAKLSLVKITRLLTSHMNALILRGALIF